MAPRKPKPNPSEAINPDPASPGGFDADTRDWSEEMANSCAAPALPAMSDPQGARSGDEEVSKVKTPNPYPFRSDPQTGVILLEDRQLRKMLMKFDMKPSDEVRQALRDAGFRWKSTNQAWEIPVDREQSWTARAQADKIFKDVTGMIRQELGIAHEVT